LILASFFFKNHLAASGVYFWSLGGTRGWGLDELVTAAGRLSATFSSVAALAFLSASFRFANSSTPPRRRTSVKAVFSCCFPPPACCHWLLTTWYRPMVDERKFVKIFDRVGGGRVS
jgi:hypothetical protein